MSGGRTTDNRPWRNRWTNERLEFRPTEIKGWNYEPQEFIFTSTNLSWDESNRESNYNPVLIAGRFIRDGYGGVSFVQWAKERVESYERRPPPRGWHTHAERVLKLWLAVYGGS